MAPSWAGGSGPWPVITVQGPAALWSGSWLEGDLVSEGFEVGDEAAGFAFGVQAAVEIVGAEFAVGGSGGQDMPDDDEDGMGDDDDGLVLGGAAAVAAGLDDVPVVEGLKVAVVPGC